MPRYREPLDSVVYRFLFASPLPVRRNLLANGTHPPAPYWRAPSFFFIEKGAQAVDLQCVERRCERMTPGFPFVPLEYWKADRCPAREPTVESMAYRFQKKRARQSSGPLVHIESGIQTSPLHMPFLVHGHRNVFQCHRCVLCHQIQQK